MDKLTPLSVFENYSRDWDGFSIAEITGVELVSLSVAGGHEKEFAKAMKTALGCALPAPGTVVPAGEGLVMWTAPGQYLAMIPGGNDRADEELAAAIGATGYAVLQSDGWGILQISGDKIFDVLERFVPLNLRNCADNFAARTSAHHMAVICVRLLDGAWLLLTPRTSAAGFLESLEHVTDNVIG